MILLSFLLVEFHKFVAQQEKCRKKWHVAEEENHETMKFIAKHKVSNILKLFFPLLLHFVWFSLLFLNYWMWSVPFFLFLAFACKVVCYNQYEKLCLIFWYLLCMYSVYFGTMLYIFLLLNVYFGTMYIYYSWIPPLLIAHKHGFSFYLGWSRNPWSKIKDGQVSFYLMRYAGPNLCKFRICTSDHALHKILW